ncbi:uncharacterized protein [Penaeus vannamei]|uniref:uncharacterized protein n=1 Tax=Penaeus vannamei TaxID=6689 RepID=UPI00387F611C
MMQPKRRLVRRTRSLLKRDKEQFIRNLAEEVEGHFLVNYLRPASQALRKLNSKPSSQVTAACSAEYFEQLYQVDPPTVNLDAGSAKIPLLDPPISEDVPSLTEVLLRRIRDHLLRHQRLEQSGFTPGKSTIDCILALRVIIVHLHDWIMGRATVQSHCGATLGNIKVTDLDFADVAILSESSESVVVALDAFSNEAKPLGLEVSWTKTKIQEFGDILGETV